MGLRITFTLQATKLIGFAKNKLEIASCELLRVRHHLFHNPSLLVLSISCISVGLVGSIVKTHKIYIKNTFTHKICGLLWR